MPNFIKAMVGGYGSGKTHAGAMRSIYLSYVNSPHPGQYVSPTFNVAKKTIIIALREILDRSQIDYVYHKQPPQFIISEWGGNIWIASGDDPDSLKGPNLAWAGIDEPFLQSIDVYKQMNARVRIKDAPQREIFLTGTPEQLNWGYDLIHNKRVGHSKGELDVGVVFAKTEDNFHNAEDYVPNLRATYDENELKAYLDGEFLNLTAGRVYKDFNRSMIHERPDLDFLVKQGTLPVMAGIDFNVDAMSAELFYKGPTWIHVFDEIRLKNANTFDLADALKINHPGITVYPDASGAARKTSSTSSDHEILRQAGFKVIAKAANPPVKERVLHMNKLLRGVDKESGISFSNCPELISDLERCVWRSGDIDKRDDERTHASDALGYAVDYLFPIHGGITSSSRW